jgi:polar amino acid transport system substrate-binding protein
MQYFLKSSLVLVLCLLSLFSQAAQRDLQAILDSGELRVGLSTFEPWTIQAKDGSLIGSEVDIAQRLAADMKLKAKLGVYEWGGLMTALNNGEIDIIIAGMAITPSRALQVEFSRPYASAGIGVVVNTSLTENFTSIKDMRNESVNVAVVTGTVAEDMAKRLVPQATLKAFSNPQDAEKAVVNGDVHAYVESIPGPNFLALQYPDKVDVPVDKPLYSTCEAFAVRKGSQALLNFLNAWIEARSADAWLESTRRYWFESLGWREQQQ